MIKYIYKSGFFAFFCNDIPKKQEMKTMIYSENINKVCALCRYAEYSDPGAETAYCTLHKKNVDSSAPDCGRFVYDIFKRTVRRKKRLKTGLTAEDFKL